MFKSLTGGVALGELHGHGASVSPSVKWAVYGQGRRSVLPGSSHFASGTQPSLHLPASPTAGGHPRDQVLANTPWETVMFASHGESTGGGTGPRRR